MLAQGTNFAIWRQLTKRAHDGLYLLSNHIACISRLAERSEEWYRYRSVRSVSGQNLDLELCFQICFVWIGYCFCSEWFGIHIWFRYMGEKTRTEIWCKSFLELDYWQAFLLSLNFSEMIWELYESWLLCNHSYSHLHFLHRKEELKKKRLKKIKEYLSLVIS